MSIYVSTDVGEADSFDQALSIFFKNSSKEDLEYTYYELQNLKEKNLTEEELKHVFIGLGFNINLSLDWNLNYSSYKDLMENLITLFKNKVNN